MLKLGTRVAEHSCCGQRALLDQPLGLVRGGKKKLFLKYRLGKGG